MARTKHPRRQRASLAASATVAGSAALLLTAAPVAAASNCNANTYYYARQVLDGSVASGLEGNIASPQGLTMNGVGHIVAYHSDAITHTLNSTSCPHGALEDLCWIQAGSGIGTIGAGADASSWHPYVEEYADGSSPFATFRNDLDASPVAFYAIYYDGSHFSDSGKTYYHWDAVYAADGNIVLLASGYYTNALEPAGIQSSVELIRTTNGACPAITNEETGTHGYGTYVDGTSKLRLLVSGSWTPWEGSYQTEPPTVANAANPPFNTYGWFANKSAWNTSAK